MERTITFTIFFFLLVVFGFSQPLSLISGTIIDQTTKEPIPYANIGIEGTYTGGASDIAGNFEFKVPSTNTGTFILASAVGYKGIRIPINEIKNGKLQLEMIPVAYDLAVVSVNAQSLVLYRIIKSAIEAIGKNYVKGPFSEKAYYKSEVAVNKDSILKDEAIVEISDMKGYIRESDYQSYIHINYRFLGVRRNFGIKSLADGMNLMDDLLSIDIVRSGGNILDENFLKNYDLSQDQSIQFEGDSVWVINYLLKEPDLSRTGDYYVISYRGKIFISKTNYAVLKNETFVKTSYYSTFGRSFAKTTEPKWIPSSIDYEFSTIYRKEKNVYKMSYLKYIRHSILKNATSGEIKSLTFTNHLIPTELNILNPLMFKGRTYYTELAFDKSFWNGFNLIVK